MSRPFLLLALVICSAGSGAAQQSVRPIPFSPATEPHLSQPQIDLAKVQRGISAAYYHPDDLSGMDCGAVIGWSAVMKQLKQQVPPERLKVLDGMNVEMHARRGKPTEVTVTWANGEPTNKQSMEDNARQMLHGFFQMYWPIFASSMGPGKSDTVRVEVRDGGGYTLHTNSAGNVVTEEVDSDLLPVKLLVNSAAMDVQVMPHFSPSPNPMPGDLRRLTSMDARYQIGTTTMTMRFEIDYQTVGGFHIPKRVSTSVGGAYAVPLDLIGCSVSKGFTVWPPPQ